jgi:cytochrome c5
MGTGMMRLLGVLAAGAMLAACGAKPAPMTAERSATLSPQDARLAGLYETSCKTCHTIEGSGAPLTGDEAAWAPRGKQGMATLVAHTVQGFKAMPAGGQCAACSAADLEALIVFMSTAPE